MSMNLQLNGPVSSHFWLISLFKTCQHAHTSYTACRIYQGSFCRLPQGTLSDVSEYEQDISLIIERWAWIYSWMDLFYVIFGSSSYFDKGIIAIFHTLNHKHLGDGDRHLCARSPTTYRKMYDIVNKIGRWVWIEHWLVLFHLIFWSSSYFNPGIVVIFYAVQQ